MTDALHKDAGRGALAEALLRNELLKECFDALEQSYIEAWKISSVRDGDGHKALHIAVNVVGKVRSQLHAVASNGKLAQRELDEIARMGERKKVSA